VSISVLQVLTLDLQARGEIRLSFALLELALLILDELLQRRFLGVETAKVGEGLLQTDDF